MAELTPKQTQFVAEYLKDLNATQAAIRAGYSKKRADAIGYENLRKPDIAAAIEAAMAERASTSKRDANMVLEDIQRLTQEAWRDGDLRTALKGLEMEGKHLGMFTEKVNLSGDIKTVIEIRDRRNGRSG